MTKMWKEYKDGYISIWGRRVWDFSNGMIFATLLIFLAEKFI